MPEENVSLFDETVITGRHFKTKVKEICEMLEDFSVKDLKATFQQAMTARGAVQDMSNFEPFTVAYVDLFIRQISGAMSAFDYDTLCEFYDYVKKLSIKPYCNPTS